MRVWHNIRSSLVIAALSLVIATSAHAGVFISVRFAPPALPIYVQPPCPEPNLIWTPGYWAYDYDAEQYYWVPGAWVPAPYEGALWTPPYWGWDDDVYIFHPGYWGWHVGYYGGVNYGFGYMGVGFVGGEWHDHDFEYNTAVVNVNRTIIHNTYVNETIVHNTTIVNNRVSYEGGPGGVRHDPTPQERVAFHEEHLSPTHSQLQHMQEARLERTNFYNANHGRPQTVALPRPLPAERRVPPPQNPILSSMRGGERQTSNVNRPENSRPIGSTNNYPEVRPGATPSRETGIPQIGSRGAQATQLQHSSAEPRSFSEPRYQLSQPQRPAAAPRSFNGPTYQAPQQQRPMAEPRAFNEPRYQAPPSQRPMQEPRSYNEPRYQAPQQRPLAAPRSFNEPRYQAPQPQRPMAEPRSFSEPRYQAPQPQRPMAEPRAFSEPRYQVPQPQRPIPQPRSFNEPRYQTPQPQRPISEPRAFNEPRHQAPQPQRSMQKPRSYNEPRYQAPQQRPLAAPRSFNEPRYQAPQPQRPMAEPHSFSEPRYHAPQPQRRMPPTGNSSRTRERDRH